MQRPPVGTMVQARQPPGPLVEQTRTSLWTLVPKNEEHPTRGVNKSPLVQTKLSIIMDQSVSKCIEKSLEDAGAHADLRRMAALRDTSAAQSWLCALSSHHGRTLEMTNSSRLCERALELAGH